MARKRGELPQPFAVSPSRASLCHFVAMPHLAVVFILAYKESSFPSFPDSAQQSTEIVP
jgi:hypothetical protein